MSRLWPKSLLGQLMLLVALALFVAQAINFALLLRAGQNLRFAEAAGPMVERIARVSDRISVDDLEQPRGRRGRVRIEDESAVFRDGLERLPRGEAALRTMLETAGVDFSAVELGRSATPPPRRFERRNPRRDSLRRQRDWLRVSVQIDNDLWINGWMPQRKRSIASLGVTIAQTLILYMIVLAALFWFARRLSRPLRDLTAATEAFDPSSPGDAVAVRGPQDIGNLVEAHNAMRVRIGAMLDEKDHMLGAIGHDLRTPLAALRIRAENVEDEAERARMVETITDMNTTLEDILSLARLGRPSEGAEMLDLTALVDSAIEDFRDVGAEVALTDSPRMIVRGRTNLLKRAIRNLIDNAVRYGGQADVQLFEKNAQAIIQIDDKGPGIPPDQLERVFEPFARLEESRNRDGGGSGLGLALARAIIRDHKGSIELINRDESGLRADVRLPLGKAD